MDHMDWVPLAIGININLIVPHTHTGTGPRLGPARVMMCVCVLVRHCLHNTTTPPCPKYFINHGPHYILTLLVSTMRAPKEAGPG